jgi:hypothetical protein
MSIKKGIALLDDRHAELVGSPVIEPAGDDGPGGEWVDEPEDASATARS